MILRISKKFFDFFEYFPITLSLATYFSITLQCIKQYYVHLIGSMKTILLFFFLDDDDPVLQVGLELRDYESESGRKQSFSYDVS